MLEGGTELAQESVCGQDTLIRSDFLLEVVVLVADSLDFLVLLFF